MKNAVVVLIVNEFALLTSGFRVKPSVIFETCSKNHTNMNEFIIQELAEIKRNTLLSAKKILTIEDVVVLTGLARNYIYNLTCRKEIPYYRPLGKKIYFDRDEIEAWLKQNRVETREESESKAAAYCAGKNATL